MIPKEQTNTALYGETIVSKFGGYLRANEPAMNYLIGRGIARSFIDTNEVGYCPPFYNFWFPLMRGRITIPIRDAYGNLVAFAGRIYEPSKASTIKILRELFSKKVSESDKIVNKWESAKWINEPYAKSQHLYNLNNAKWYGRKSGFIVVVEGYFDVQVLSGNGIPETVALCGTGLSDKHCVLLSRYVDDVIFVLDGDSAGENAITKIFVKSKEFGLRPHAIYLPYGYDPDDFVLKIGGNKFRLLLYRILDKQLDEFVVRSK